MAVVVMISVKDGTDIQKIIKKCAIMLNKLFTVIFILPGVDSSEDLSFSNYSSTTTTTSTFTDYSDDASKIATTIIPVIYETRAINKKIITPTEKAGIVIGTIIGILTLITACCTFYHQFYKTKSTVHHEGNPGNNYGDNYGGNNFFWCCNDRTVNCNNVCNTSVTRPTTINQNQTVN